MRFYGQAKGRRWDTEQVMPAFTNRGKQCKKCGEWKSADAFHNYRTRTGTLSKRGVCKVCESEQKRTWYRRKKKT